MRSLKMIFAKALVCIGVFGLWTSAYADVDVTCVLDNCLQEGWQVYNERNGQSSLISCHEGDCLLNGWSEEFRGRLVTQTNCKPGGCFNDGWQVFNAANGRLIAEVSCLNSFAGQDCLENGWDTYEIGRGRYTTRCINGDCRNYGWDIFAQGFAPQPVRCKNGGCFNAGWVILN